MVWPRLEHRWREGWEGRGRWELELAGSHGSADSPGRQWELFSALSSPTLMRGLSPTGSGLRGAEPGSQVSRAWGAQTLRGKGSPRPACSGSFILAPPALTETPTEASKAARLRQGTEPGFKWGVLEGSEKSGTSLQAGTGVPLGASANTVREEREGREGMRK